MKDANGRALKLDGGQHGERVVRPLHLRPGQTESYRYTVTMALPRGRKLPSVSLMEPTAYFYSFHDLRPGEYTLQLAYQCHDAKLGGMAQVLNDKELTPDTPLWVGKAESKPITVRVWPEKAAAEQADAPLLREAYTAAYPQAKWEEFTKLSGAARWDVIRKIAERMAKTDLIKTLQTACSLTDRIDRDCFALGVAAAWADEEAKAAADWVPKADTSNPVALFQIIFGRWAKAKPAESADYVTRMSAGHNQAMCMQFVLEQWAPADAKAAMAWAETLPDAAQPAPDLQFEGMGGKTWPINTVYCRKHAVALVRFYGSSGQP